MSIMAQSLAAVFGQVPPGVIFMDATTRIDALRVRAQEIQDASDQLIATADGEDRDLTEAELRTLEENRQSVDRIVAQIRAREPTVTAGPGRRTSPDGADPQNVTQPGSGQPTRVSGTRANARTHGFRTFGEFAQIVYAAGRNSHSSHREANERLLNVATTFGAESVGADGGFAVPPEFRQAIWQKVMSQENLITRCDTMEIGGNSITIPKDETTPWQTSGGVLAYWEGEGDAATASKPQLNLDTLRLGKLMALVPISEELLEDAPAIESWLRLKAPAKLVSKVNTAIVRGTGTGQPLGILNAESLISVAKEASQDAATVWFGNIVKMWSRLWAPSRANAIWLINQDVEQSLYQMAFDPEASSKVPVYLPPGGLNSSPYGMLMGRPVVPVEPCSTLGTQGDIILTDLTQYLVLRKAGQDIRTDVSMHLYFDQALQAFRFIFRVNGQPMWGSTLTPENGSNTRSWAVTLDARP